MKIIEVTEPEDETDHFAALDQTGFYGRAAAGCLLLAKSTGRLGIAHRSRQVEQPGTHGTVGGAINPGDDPLAAAIRETVEEVGYQKQSGDYLIPLDVFQSGTFRYTTFLYVIEQEFQARLNWESDGFDWYSLENLPSPLHFGLAGTLGKPECVRIIQQEINKNLPQT